MPTAKTTALFKSFFLILSISSQLSFSAPTSIPLVDITTPSSLHAPLEHTCDATHHKKYHRHPIKTPYSSSYDPQYEPETSSESKKHYTSSLKNNKRSQEKSSEGKPLSSSSSYNYADAPNESDYYYATYEPTLEEENQQEESYPMASNGPYDDTNSSHNQKPVLEHEANGKRPKALNLTIIHTNDIHAHLDEFNKYGTDCRPKDIENKECYGGIARIKTVVDQYRSSTENMVLFDAGDQFQGTLFYNYFKGEKITIAMNDILEYDLMTIGNHEFDDGEKYLGHFLSTLNFPVVASNIDLKTAPYLKKAGVKPYVVLEKYNLGVIGFITNTTGSLASGAKHILFKNPVPPVQQAVDELHAMGIKKIVCVSHNGYTADQYLAANTRGINLIVGGHSHSLLANNLDDERVVGPFPTNVTNLDRKMTYIVQAHRFGNFIGQVDLSWDEDEELIGISGDPIKMDHTIPQHPETVAQVKSWRKVFEAKTKEVIAKLTKDMPLQDCKYYECLLGNFVSDALYDYIPDADIAMINDGGLRAGILAGHVSVADLLTVLPFPNTIIGFRANGTEIMQVLERISAQKREDNGLLVGSLGHWSGLRYTYNGSLPEFQRVVDVQVKDRSTGKYGPIEFDREYTISTPDFMAQGGDNMFDERKDVVSGSIVFDVVENYIKNRLTSSSSVVNGQPIMNDRRATGRTALKPTLPIIDPKIEGRIVQLDA